MSPAWVRFLVYNTCLVQYRWTGLDLLTADRVKTQDWKIVNSSKYSLSCCTYVFHRWGFVLAFSVLAFPPLHIRTYVFRTCIFHPPVLSFSVLAFSVAPKNVRKSCLAMLAIFFKISNIHCGPIHSSLYAQVSLFCTKRNGLMPLKSTNCCMLLQRYTTIRINVSVWETTKGLTGVSESNHTVIGKRHDSGIVGLSLVPLLWGKIVVRFFLFFSQFDCWISGAWLRNVHRSAEQNITHLGPRILNNYFTVLLGISNFGAMLSAILRKRAEKFDSALLNWLIILRLNY